VYLSCTPCALALNEFHLLIQKIFIYLFIAIGDPFGYFYSLL
jgi:hypothetical protein